MHEETLALRKDAFGPRDRDTLASMHEVACIYWALDKNDEALKLQEVTLAMRKVTLGIRVDDYSVVPAVIDVVRLNPDDSSTTVLTGEFWGQY